MKLTTKFSLVLLCCVIAILAGYAVVRIRVEMATQVNDMMRDHRAMGSALVIATERIWDMAGKEAAISFVEKANQRKVDVSIRWVHLEAEPGSKFAPRLDAPITLPSDGLLQVAAREKNGKRSLFTYLEVTSDGPAEGALELVESLEIERSMVIAIAGRILVTTGIIAVSVLLIAVGLGVWLVTRPVQSLIAKARRIGAGDFSGSLTLDQSIEFAELASELNSMCDRLREANTRIAAETSARIDALEQLRHADRLVTIGKIASSIAHELGTPLQVVLARAKMIVSGEAKGERIEANAKVIVEQAERIAQIIRQLLDFARLRMPHKTRTDISQIVRRTLSLLAPIATRQHVTFVTSGDSPYITEVDPDQLQQVLSNIVLNGIQAMPDGGQLTVELHRSVLPPPNSGTRAPVPCVEICIFDEGKGIAEQDVQRIFEPFFTTKGAGKGTGLGLSVVEGIIREHGGWIEVSSTPSNGACFRVYLPEGDHK